MTPLRSVVLSKVQAESCNFTKSNTPPWFVKIMMNGNY